MKHEEGAEDREGGRDGGVDTAPEDVDVLVGQDRPGDDRCRRDALGTLALDEIRRERGVQAVEQPRVVPLPRDAEAGGARESTTNTVTPPHEPSSSPSTARPMANGYSSSNVFSITAVP
jgi:hypothetical protein